MKLTRKQVGAASLPDAKVLMISGSAGTGKTTVGIERAKYLKSKVCSAGDSILFLTFTKSLTSYIYYLSKQVFQEDGQAFMDFEDVDIVVERFSKLQQPDYIDYLKEHELTPGNLGFSSEFLQKSIIKVKPQFPNIDKFSEEFLQDEIEWILSTGVASLPEYLEIDRNGRSKFGVESKRLAKNSEDRKAIYNVVDYYIRHSFLKDNISWSLRDLICSKMSDKSVRKKYNHIIVDEAQDLNRATLNYINSLLNREDEKSSITLLYDPKQSIYRNSWLGVKNNLVSSVFKEEKVTRRNLNTVFRNCLSISKFANDFYDIEHVESGKDDIGFKVQHLIAPDKEKQFTVLVDVLTCLTERLDFRDIHIITRYNSEVQETIDYLNRAGTIASNITDKSDFLQNRIKVSTVHSSKGIQSKAVVFINFDSKSYPVPGDLSEDEYQSEMKLAYVGFTRAKDFLFVLGTGEKSEFIDKISEEYYDDLNCEDHKYFTEDVLGSEELVSTILNNTVLRKEKEETLRTKYPLLTTEARFFWAEMLLQFEQRSEDEMYLRNIVLGLGFKAFENQLKTYVLDHKEVDEVDLIDVGISIRGELTRLNRKESLFIFVKLCERDFHEYDLLHDQDLKENMKKILELNLIYEGRNQNAHGNFIGESVDVNQCFELLDTTLKLLSL